MNENVADGSENGKPIPRIPLQLRTDLVIQPLPGSEQSVVVKDPIAGKYFRFSGVAVQLIDMLRSPRSSEELQQVLGDGVPMSVLDGFIEQLRSSLLLDEGEGQQELTSLVKARWRLKFNVFWWRVPLFNPDRFLARLALFFRPLFHPVQVIFAVVLFLGGLVLYFMDVRNMHEKFWSASPSSLLVYWLTVIVLVAIHELSHGIVCKKFGGEVREIGFLLLFLSPCFYTNISDTYMIPERSKRLWVAFAGAYIELVIWSFAVFMAYFFEPTGIGGQILHSVLVFAGLRTVALNLNPLIRLDGYYLLIEWLEIPNLRRRAFAFLGNLLRPAKGRRSTQHIPARLRKIFTIYATISLVYVLFFLSLIGYRLGIYLTAKFGLLGIVPVIVFALLILHSLFRQLFAGEQIKI